MSAVRTILALAIAGVFILGCVGPVKHKFTTDFPAPIVYAIGTPPVSDGRERFREIFCQILAKDPAYQGQAGICENFLWRLSDEPVPRGLPGPLPTRKTGYRVLVVPGFLNECFANIALPFEDSIESLNDRGYKISELVVSGRSSSDSNAIFIADTIENLNLSPDEKLVLIGHSKGAVDILHFLVNYPEAVPRVAAVVSVAGAINGSPLAAAFSEIYNSLSRNILSERCNTGDDGAMDSLQPAVRLSWLAANSLPDTVRYFSLAAFARYEDVQLHQRATYKLLEQIEPLNDGQLLFLDQLIPGSALLGYVNADHWTVAVPVEEEFSGRDPALMAENSMLREFLFEAMILFLAESLNPL